MATTNTNLSNYNPSTLPDATKLRFGIVVSEWNSVITEGLLEGARDTFLNCGVQDENIKTIYVPGSFELIFGAKKMQEQALDAVIVIGSVIKGETQHFDFVCEGVTQGIKDLNVLNNVPVIFCVLTDNNFQQSIDRSGGKHGNKGVEAAVTAIKMAHLNHSL
jgi:6,7-dimethyl-8-ribityllumazine synthase